MKKDTQKFTGGIMLQSIIKAVQMLRNASKLFSLTLCVDTKTSLCYQVINTLSDSRTFI